MTSAPGAAKQGDRPGAQQSFSQIDPWQQAVQSTFVPVKLFRSPTRCTPS